MTDSFLDKVYRYGDDTRRLYDDWAETYDAELEANGYATPRRGAEALAAHLSGRARPVLDFGCGTGLSGLALKRQGFEVIDGVDVSADMLREAGEKKAYRKLAQIAPGAPLDHSPGTYAAITCIGVIGAGAAPLEAFDTVMNGLAPGGLLVFSFNDHTLEDPSYEAKLDSYLEADRARLLFKEHGPHIRGRALGATVYVIEKL